MSAFVLDASVTMSWLLGDARPADDAYAAAVLDSLRQPDCTALVPMTWALEIGNVVVRAEARGLVDEAQSEAFLEMLAGVAIQPDDATFARALTDTLHVARRYALSSYDASYLELALRAGAPIATLDADLSKSARKAGVKRFTPH
ncbi:MAG TPA: type II toxin-antitoxin system VapC family toxin [Steroidobacteraceae bacterium]|nr:type II toxin-antitoxin system VapC family toxin [Steroidobacteraceae bacterium]